MSGADVIGELPLASPRRLLDDLATLARALVANGRARPEIEMYLASGQLLRGRLASVGDSSDGAVALLMIGGSAAAPSVAYVKLQHVVAVTVLDASLLVRAAVSEGPPPTKLELARTVAARSDALMGTLGRSLALSIAPNLDDEGRRAVIVLLPVLVDVLVGLAADELGRSALAPITQIELDAAAAADVSKDGAKLIVRAPKLLTEALTAPQLLEKISSLL